METKVENEGSTSQQKAPLSQSLLDAEEKTLTQKAISKTSQSTAHLANHLPTGTVLVLQLLSPIFTNQAECNSVGRSLTAALIALCGLLCFLLSFTDSFKNKKGNICYGFATFHGLWVIDDSATPEDPAKYRLKVIDFVHAFMSILVFAVVALYDQNIIKCFFPTTSDETKKLLAALPVGIGAICSTLFVVFPTQRHGIGFPLTKN